MKRTYSLEEVGAQIASHLKDPKQFLTRRIKAGDIPACKIGGRWAMTEDQIEAALEFFSTGPEPDVMPTISLTDAALRRRAAS